VSEIKYVKTSDTYSEKLLSEAQQNRMYDDVVYRFKSCLLPENLDSDEKFWTAVLDGQEVFLLQSKSPGRKFLDIGSRP